jgi:glyoxylase-like metal-dependent hydrolase (beta-lactamase superfamily II)
MRQVLPDIYLLEGLRVAHVYVLVSEDGLTLIDSGMPGEADKIVKQIEEAGYALSDIRAIVMTHAHSDHTGCMAELARRSGAQVLAHRDEADYLEQTASLPYKTFMQRLIFGLSERMMSRFEPCKVDQPLQDGDVVEALGGLQVVHVPGHTPGSIALYQPERRVLFCGDAIFNQLPIGGKQGVRFPPAIVCVDSPQAQASARKLAALPAEAVCFGHGEPILEGAGEKMRAALGTTG